MTYTDIAAVWEATDLQHCFLGASKLTAKVCSRPLCVAAIAASCGGGFVKVKMVSGIILVLLNYGGIIIQSGFPSAFRYNVYPGFRPKTEQNNFDKQGHHRKGHVKRSRIIEWRKFQLKFQLRSTF